VSTNGGTAFSHPFLALPLIVAVVPFCCSVCTVAVVVTVLLQWCSGNRIAVAYCIMFVFVSGISCKVLKRKIYKNTYKKAYPFCVPYTGVED